MTTVDSMQFTCNVCKKESKQYVVMSTNSCGYCDLDLRPPEMQRSIMYQLIQECPHCGNVSYDISDNEIRKEFLNSNEYKTCNGINFASDSSKKFYKAYLIAKENNSLNGQITYARDCAWSCDDFDDVENAIIMRKICIELFNILISEETDNIKKNHLKVMKSDFMRRACEFDALIDEYDDAIFDDELLDKIIQFEIKKAKEKDNCCYTIEVIE